MNKAVWKVERKVELEIIDLALTHIKKVELDPEVITEGDNFDYWHSYQLEDGNFVDYNIYMGEDSGDFPDFLTRMYPGIMTVMLIVFIAVRMI